VPCNPGVTGNVAIPGFGCKLAQTITIEPWAEDYGFLIKPSGLSEPYFPSIELEFDGCISSGSAFASQPAKEGTQMGPKWEQLDQEVVGHCSACGHVTELFELPGRAEKYCLACSADIATSVILSAEIDAATMNGSDANALVCEFAEISSRMLVRAQSE
jgi:hypothetical protein